MATPQSHGGKRITEYSHYFNKVASRRISQPYKKIEVLTMITQEKHTAIPALEWFEKIVLQTISPNHSKAGISVCFSCVNRYKKLIPKDSWVSLDGGLPNAIQFPVAKATFTSRDGSKEFHIDADEMKTVLQYGQYSGLAELRAWVEGLYKRVHNPPTMDGKQLPSSLELQICSGGREGVSKTFRALLEEGDSFVAEEAIYQSVSPTYIPLGVTGVPIRSDDEGMDAAHLRQVLSEWKEETQGRRPRLLYAIPTSSNPTGMTWSDRRKKEIYDVTRQFDLLILEDDPYYYMQFKMPLSPSLLSMDTDGRVIRTDSFSKTISPGIRVGLLFGPKQVINNIQQDIFVDSGGCSSLSQMMVYKIVQPWGYDGFLEHANKLTSFYKQRAEKAVQLANKYLKGLCEWRNPDGGMFMWFKLLKNDNSEPILEEVMKKGVFLMDGSKFSLDRTPRPFVRLCYSRASDKELEKVHECRSLIITLEMSALMGPVSSAVFVGISVFADVMKNFTHQKG